MRLLLNLHENTLDSRDEDDTALQVKGASIEVTDLTRDSHNWAHRRDAKEPTLIHVSQLNFVQRAETA